MSKDDPSPNANANANGKTPKLDMPEALYFERGPVICRRCNRKFEPFVIEEIDDISQLRCGDVLIANVRLVCTRCGCIYSWELNAKKLETMAVKYGEFTTPILNYKPE